jgi:urease accessory protein
MAGCRMKAFTVLALLVAGLLCAAPAEAHLVETGFGAFYDGVVHLVVTPADLLLVLAIALLAGQRGARAARFTLIVLPLAWLAGAVLGSRSGAVAAMPWLTTVPFAAAGVLVALNVKVNDWAVGAFAASAGLLHGMASAPALGASSSGLQAMSTAIGGSIVAVACLSTLVAGEVVALPSGWPRIVVRVAGSWIAAAGLLMLGWLAR